MSWQFALRRVPLIFLRSISLIDDPMTRQAWALFATTSCFMFAWYPATTSLVFGGLFVVLPCCIWADRQCSALVCIPSLRHTLTSNSFYHLSSPSTDFEVAAAHQRSSFWRSPLGPRLLTKQCPLSLRRLQEGGEVAVAGLSGPWSSIMLGLLIFSVRLCFSPWGFSFKLSWWAMCAKKLCNRLLSSFPL